MGVRARGGWNRTKRVVVRVFTSKHVDIVERTTGAMVTDGWELVGGVTVAADGAGGFIYAATLSKEVDDSPLGQFGH